MNKRLSFFLLWSLLLTVSSVTAYAQGSFIYTNNHGAETITGFSVGPDGSLTEVPGSPFLRGGVDNGGGIIPPYMITSVRVGSFLYASSRDSGTISAFAINPLTGFLTPVPGSPFIAGTTGQTSLAATPDGKYLFQGSLIFSVSSNIAVYRIGESGELTPVPGSPFRTEGGLIHMATSPDSRFLAVAQWFSRSVAIFRISPDGTLMPAGPPLLLQSGGISVSLDFNCAGNQLFVMQNILGQPAIINVFSVSPSGALTHVAGSPFTAPGSGLSHILLSPDDRHLFVSNLHENTLEVFNVAPTGSLSLVPGSPFANIGGLFPSTLATDQAGSFLYVANQNGTVSAFAISPAGALTPVQGSPFNAGQFSSPMSLTSYPPKSCEQVLSFDTCIQSGEGVLRINTETGEYQFTNCAGIILSGVGTLKTKGCTTTLTHNSSDRRILAMLNTCQKRGTASVQVFSARRTFNLTDLDITDGCGCN